MKSPEMCVDGRELKADGRPVGKLSRDGDEVYIDGLGFAEWWGLRSWMNTITTGGALKAEMAATAAQNTAVNAAAVHASVGQMDKVAEHLADADAHMARAAVWRKWALYLARHGTPKQKGETK